MKVLSLGYPFLVLTACLVLTGCYRAESISASVVDAESGQPVEGVYVVANWQVMGRMTDGNNEGQLMVMEAATDKNGRFVFPGWGPKMAWVENIKGQRTRLLFLKSGYQPLVLSNEVGTNYGYNPALQSDWNGKTIQVRTANSHPIIRIQEFDLFNIDLHPIVRNAATCPWKKIPNMLREVRKERLALVAHALTPGAWPIASVDEDLIGNAEFLSREGGGACGSPKDIFLSNSVK
jgi:hypothetical protein